MLGFTDRLSPIPLDDIPTREPSENRILALTIGRGNQIDKQMKDMFESIPQIYVRTALGNSIDVTTMKILKMAYEEANDKNVVCSPLGVMMLLSLYNEGAGPEAKNEIINFIGGYDPKRVTISFKELSKNLSEMSPRHITVVNKISVSEEYSLNEHFAAAARAYRCYFDTVDFTKPEEAADFINFWASEETRGRIRTPISKDTLAPDTAVALLNVIFFKGRWREPFNKSETNEKDFHVSRSLTVKKPMMHLLRPLSYFESEELNAKLVELPYRERGFRMVIVLPNEIDGLPTVLEKAAERGILGDVFNLKPAGILVELYMPKFEIRTKLNYNDILPKVGVGKIFEEEAPKVGNAPVKVSKVFQEVFIKVSEEGVTAGSFTDAVLTSTQSKSPPANKFTVDHPFLYVILTEEKILIAGTCTH